MFTAGEIKLLRIWRKRYVDVPTFSALKIMFLLLPRIMLAASFQLMTMMEEMELIAKFKMIVRRISERSVSMKCPLSRCLDLVQLFMKESFCITKLLIENRYTVRIRINAM